MWDFFDTPDAANIRDGRVTIADIVRIVSRFGASGNGGLDPRSVPPPPPAYHTAFDRAAPASGGDPWDAAAADGVVSTTDIVLAVAQFGHTCA
jgi:hypothetical protein